MDRRGKDSVGRKPMFQYSSIDYMESEVHTDKGVFLKSMKVLYHQPRRAEFKTTSLLMPSLDCRLTIEGFAELVTCFEEWTT